MLVVEFLYAVTSIGLALYGLNCLYLLWRYWRTRSSPLEPPASPVEWPCVTVQLPVFNEIHTVERLLRAVAQLDYPREQLEVQVLDDSTDATPSVIGRVAAELRAGGLAVTHLRRRGREGYKAGALAAGLRSAAGTLIAVLDADFVPPTDFLRRTVPHFLQPNIGCVQARWAHLNAGYSLLSRAQALGVDGHFVVEQAARQRSGLFMNFNGTAGVWRRAAIEAAGGWQGDTLCEDLDLSYRAQLAGWRFVYLPDLAVPAELPVQMEAYMRQQARWARGSMQTARKLLGQLARARVPIGVKVEGVLHLTGYVVHPLMLATIALALPMSLSHSPVLRLAPYFMVAAIGPPLVYLLAATPEGPGWGERLRLLPCLLALGVGLSLNNSRAVLAGLFAGDRGEFARTPKFAVGPAGAGSPWQASSYALLRDARSWGELALLVLTLSVLALIGPDHSWGFIPWLLLYACGFGYVGCLNLWQAAQLRRLAVAGVPPGCRRRAERETAECIRTA